MDMAKGVTFSIRPDAQRVTVALFQRSIEDVVRLILDVDYALNRERNPRRWVIAELHSSIPTITIAPVLDDPRIVDTVLAGLKVIAAGEVDVPPAYFTEQALDHLKAMQRLFRGRDRAKEIIFSSNGDKAILDSGIKKKVERILGGGYWNLGSVEGSLDAVNLHGQPTFTVWDRVSGAPVRCLLPAERGWKDKVKSLLEKRVLVVGKVQYFGNGLPRSVSSIETITDSSPNHSLPRAHFGCIPDSEAARDPVEFLRRIRTGG